MSSKNKRKKIEYTYEVVESDPMTEAEVEDLARLLAKMIYDHIIRLEKEKKEVETPGQS